jgi:hypothetical protein
MIMTVCLFCLFVCLFDRVAADGAPATNAPGFGMGI